jgi:hypothetical protein
MFLVEYSPYLNDIPKNIFTKYKSDNIFSHLINSYIHHLSIAHVLRWSTLDTWLQVKRALAYTT